MNDQSTPPRFFTAADAPPDGLAGQSVTVLGYGNLGRALALNLRDASLLPLIGNIEDEYATQARADGFEVKSLAEATAAADICLALLPDEVLPEVFTDHIAPALKEHAAVVLASGYTLAYGLFHPADNIDVLLMAPRMGGETIRKRYLNGEGFFTYISVEQDASGRAWPRLLGLADAVGSLRMAALELDARREADLDLFIEQSMGAIVGLAIMVAFDLGVKAGIPPEAMALEMYMSGEMEEVFRAFRQTGFFKASEFHGPTALYGGMAATMALDRAGMEKQFQHVLDDIRSGEFARRFQAEREAGYPLLKMAHQMIVGSNPISDAEESVRRHLSR
jgi:ketol-acid reductoisomerase